jgi:hypothetical protein
VLVPVTVVVLAACAVLAAAGLFYLWRDRLFDDLLLGIAAVLELGLLVQAVAAVVHVRDVAGGGAEQTTFAAYALTLPVVPPAVMFLAIKEKTRWAMGVVVGGMFAVAVMTGRMVQIWGSSRG